MSLRGAERRGNLLFHALRLLRYARNDISRKDAFPASVNAYCLGRAFSLAREPLDACRCPNLLSKRHSELTPSRAGVMVAAKDNVRL